MKNISSILAKLAILFFLAATVAPSMALVSDAYANTDPNLTDNGTGTGTGTGTGGTFVAANSNDNALVDAMCNVFRVVTGNAGKAFAAFAILSVGIGFFTGKVSWGLMIGVAAGIAAMFGAPTIVAAISGEDAYDCGN